MKHKEDMINLTSLNKHVKGINYTNGPRANHSYKSEAYHNCGLGTYPLDVDDDLLFQNYVASDQIL